MNAIFHNSSPVSTLSKFKLQLNVLTPPDLAKWSNFDSWSSVDQKWFRKNIPTYELDCQMELNPFENSLKHFNWDSLAGHPIRNNSSTMSTTSRSLADIFRDISSEIKESKVSTVPNLSPKLSSTVSLPTVVRPHSYESLDFGVPPEMDYGSDLEFGLTSPPF